MDLQNQVATGFTSALFAAHFYDSLSSRLFPTVGGRIIAHFLCGIFNQMPIKVTEEDRKDCPLGSDAPGAGMAVDLLPCAVPADAGHAAPAAG